MNPSPIGTKKPLFPLDQYDKDFCLKVNFFTMAVMLVCCKSVLITIAAIMAQKGSGAIVHFFFFDKTRLQQSLAAAVPALLVVITWGYRHKGAHRIHRIIWRYGKLLLLTSALILVAMDVHFITGRHHVRGVELAFLCMDILCLLYILFSKRLSAIFSDFPVYSPVK